MRAARDRRSRVAIALSMLAGVTALVPRVDASTNRSMGSGARAVSERADGTPRLRPADGILGIDVDKHPGAVLDFDSLPAKACAWFVWDDHNKETIRLGHAGIPPTDTLERVRDHLGLSAKETNRWVTAQEQCPDPDGIRSYLDYVNGETAGSFADRVHRWAWNVTWKVDPSRDVAPELLNTFELPVPGLSFAPGDATAPFVVGGTVNVRVRVPDPVSASLPFTIGPKTAPTAGGTVVFRADPVATALDPADEREHENRGLPTLQEPMRRYADVVDERPACRLAAISARDIERSGSKVHMPVDVLTGAPRCHPVDGVVSDLSMVLRDNSANSDHDFDDPTVAFGYAYRAADRYTTDFGGRTNWAGKPQWRVAAGVLWHVTATASGAACAPSCPTSELYVWSVAERPVLVMALGAFNVNGRDGE